MFVRNKKAANWLGLFSILFSVVPLIYIFHSEMFPQHALTEALVLFGGVGGSLFAALGAGVIGSRWWFIATLGAALDVICLLGFSP